MKLRRLNERGIEQFATYLDRLREDRRLEPPMWLLTDDDASEPAADVEVEKREFPSRMEVGQYLNQILEKAGIAEVDRDAGLWAWLSLFYFDEVCPTKKDGTRKLSDQNSRYIPAIGNFQQFYRHLLLGPYLIVSSHAENPGRALALLASRVDTISEIVEQLMSRQERLTNPAILGAATRLYVADSGKYKPGTGGKGPGSPRRLNFVLEQFELTYDLYGMNEDELLSLLPREFDRFQKA